MSYFLTSESLYLAMGLLTFLLGIFAVKLAK